MENRTLYADNYNVRCSKVCPFCGGEKDIGLVACWPCYRCHNLRNGNAVAEAIIAKADNDLARG